MGVRVEGKLYVASRRRQSGSVRSEATYSAPGAKFLLGEFKSLGNNRQDVTGWNERRARDTIVLLR